MATTHKGYDTTPWKRQWRYSAYRKYPTDETTQGFCVGTFADWVKRRFAKSFTTNGGKTISTVDQIQ